MIDIENSQWLIWVLLILGGVVFIADLVIFVRWIVYKFETYAAQPPAINSILPAPGEGAQSAYSNPDALYPVPPVQPNDPFLQAEAPYPPVVRSRPPFAPTWSVVDPFLGFQFVFLVAQVLIALFLLPVMFQPQPDAASSSGTTASRTVKPTSGAKAPPRTPAKQGAPKQPAALPPSRPAQSATPAINTGGMFSPYGLTVQIAGLILQNVLFVAVVAFFLRRYGTNLSEIGLCKPTRNEILLGLGLGAALFLLAGGMEQGLGAALKHLSPELAERLSKMTEAVTAGALFTQLKGNGWKLAFVLTGAIAAPIGEEVFFRGFLYNALKKRWGMIIGIILSGLMFALIHFGPLAVIVIFPMGMILAYVYERTRSLWVTILMHMVNNGVALILAWLFPQLGK